MGQVLKEGQLDNPLLWVAQPLELVGEENAVDN